MVVDTSSVPRQLLNRPDVRAPLKGMGGETVPEGVRAGAAGSMPTIPTAALIALLMVASST